MKDAFGGILNLVFITVFLVLVSGILGLTVNYTKAFKMKNAVITGIEQYEGYGCFDSKKDTACQQKITEYAKSIGYHPVSINCPTKDDFHSGGQYFCYSERYSSNGKKYYSIITQVDINIPIINRIMGMTFFQVHGDTRNLK